VSQFMMGGAPAHRFALQRAQALFVTRDYGLAFRMLSRILNFYTLPSTTDVHGGVVFKVCVWLRPSHHVGIGADLTCSPE
jgi:hypothetical protein